MSKPIYPLLIAFLALWLFGGAYWLSSIHSQDATQQVKFDDQRLVIRDGEFVAEASTIFAFQTSDAEIIITEEQLAVLDSIALYLEKFKEKKMRLVAHYGKQETNNSNYDNLGIARAETLKNILIRKGAPESSIEVEGMVFEKLNLNENGILSGGVEFDIFDKDISNTLTEASFLKEKKFYFQKNKYVLSDKEELEDYAATLKQYLVDEKTSEVIVTGFRDLDEHQSIDLLRAKFIKDVFVKHGIDIERISIDINDLQGKVADRNKIEDYKNVTIKVL